MESLLAGYPREPQESLLASPASPSLWNQQCLHNVDTWEKIICSSFWSLGSRASTAAVIRLLLLDRCGREAFDR